MRGIFGWTIQLVGKIANWGNGSCLWASPKEDQFQFKARKLPTKKHGFSIQKDKPAEHVCCPRNVFAAMKSYYFFQTGRI